MRTSWENFHKTLLCWVTWPCLGWVTTCCLFYLQGTEGTILELQPSDYVAWWGQWTEEAEKAGCANRDWTLDFSNNQMTTLPDEIGEVKELEWLNVRMETADWTSVITRWLQFAWWYCWSEVTNVIGDRVVYLSSRELSIVPEAVSDLTELELDLPDNYLEELPTSMNKLKNLKRLTSEGNGWENFLKPMLSWVTWPCLVWETTSCLFYLQTLNISRISGHWTWVIASWLYCLMWTEEAGMAEWENGDWRLLK